MQYKEYKEIPKLSRLGMGLMRLPVQDEDFGRIDYDKAKAIVDFCMKNGINYYDTAYIIMENLKNLQAMYWANIRGKATI